MTSSVPFPCPPPARGGCGAPAHAHYRWRSEANGSSYIRCSACGRVWSVAEYAHATRREDARPTIYRDADECGRGVA